MAEIKKAWLEVLCEADTHPVGLLPIGVHGRTLQAMNRHDLVYRSGLGDWFLTDKGHEHARITDAE